jgi:hypothetical protein
MWSTGEKEALQRIESFCDYWKSRPIVKTSVHRWQHIDDIQRDTKNSVKKLSRIRQDYSRFFSNLPIEEQRLYEEHCEEEEKRALLRLVNR